MSTPAKSFRGTRGGDPWTNWSTKSLPNGDQQVIYRVNGEDIPAGSRAQRDLMEASRRANAQSMGRR